MSWNDNIPVFMSSRGGEVVLINIVALPCLCVDVFDGTDELCAGGEALNFADGKKQHLGWSEYEYVINDGEEEIWWTRYDANGKVTERYQVTSAFVFSGRPEVDILSDYYPE